MRYQARFALGLCAVALIAAACGSEDIDIHGESAERPGLPPDLFMPTGAPVSAEVAPPPIQGGTLLVMRDGVTAVAADQDRDQVFVVDLPSRSVISVFTLNRGDQPGRLVEDNSGNVHVALRRGAAVISLAARAGTINHRRDVCAAPSGIDFDEARDVIHVACETGELVTLAAAGGPSIRTLSLGRDLRDVVVHGDNILVSRFRSADVLTLDAQGQLIDTTKPPPSSRFVFDGDHDREVTMVPSVAWRLAKSADGTPHLLHQRAALDEELSERPEEGGYDGAGEQCGSIVLPVLTPIEPGDPPIDAKSIPTALATDTAFSPDGRTIAVAATGQTFGDAGMFANVLLISTDDFHLDFDDGFHCHFGHEPFFFEGEVVSVAFDGLSEIIVQSREPAMLMTRFGEPISLSSESRLDTGLQLFHLNTGAGIACASCHPAGMDDGQVWRFDKSGKRRTQMLAGTLANTEPYHWDGSMKGFEHLFDEIFSGRMVGAPLDDAHQQVFGDWLVRLDAPPRRVPSDTNAVARGKALFDDPVVACASCHSGSQLTNNETVDVGSGMFQVPSLVGIASHPPFMHDGCATRLIDRFGSCGGSNHGKTDHLSKSQVNDLVTYLETL